MSAMPEADSSADPDSPADTAMLDAAIAAIDAANAQDPNTMQHEGEELPKELCHGRLATQWLLRLDPQASHLQQLAARGHHIKRWEIPRDSYPKDRAGYLKWRTELGRFHAGETGAIMAQAGYDADAIERVQAIVQKRNLKGDPQVQTHEDALCLVFLSTQLVDLSQDMAADKLIDVVAKTLKKMSPQGREQATCLSYGNRERRVFARALTVSKTL